MTPDDSPRNSRLWFWVLVPIALQLAAWAAWFAIASQHPVETVPLETHRPQ